MRKLLFIIVLISNSIGYAQPINKADYFEEIKERNISHLFIYDDSAINEPQPIGYIGDNFMRFRIKFISIIKNPLDSTEYLIYGKTKVKNNICSFQGKLTIDDAITYNDENEYPGENTLFGQVSGQYIFFEDQTHSGTGIFNGTFETYFSLNKNNEIIYGDLTGSSNNQFKGKWTKYKTLKSIKCNWGDFRIPDSGDLDIGEGDFIPANKYKNNGWESYILGFGNFIDDVPVDDNRRLQGLRIEKEKWWIDNK
jgi:hypothetical protein